jgi:hypothetical protein
MAKLGTYGDGLMTFAQAREKFRVEYILITGRPNATSITATKRRG